MIDVLRLLLWANLVVGAAVVVVFILRRPLARAFGARVAYGFWSLPLVAGIAAFVPVGATPLPPAAVAGLHVVWSAAVVRAAGPNADPGDSSWLLVAAWVLGVILMARRLQGQQARFDRDALAGLAGPAAVGVIRPHIVTPSDFSRRYADRERQIILAHERAHIARQDPRVNALIALARCLCWFNPFVHLMARLVRIDQELACDATVIEQRPSDRRLYAEVMLKTQGAPSPLPIGCHWPAIATHPLIRRIDLLSRPVPSRQRRRAGLLCVASLLICALVVTSEACPAPVRDTLTTYATRLGAPHAMLTPEQTEGRAALPRGEFGPSRQGWSSVAPGSAVRVVAWLVGPDGTTQTTELTAFGRRSFYRVGVRRAGDEMIFTSVTQLAGQLLVTAGMQRASGPLSSGTVSLVSGERGQVRLPDGRVIIVTPTLRPIAPAEIEQLRQGEGRRLVRVDRVLQRS